MTRHPRAWLASLGRSAGPRRTVAWLGGAVIAIIVAQAAYGIVRSYHATVEATGRELESQAHVLAEQTARSMQAIDVVMRHLAEQMRTGPLVRASDDELHAYLKEQAVGLVQADGLVLIDAGGHVRAVSQVPPAEMKQIELADNRYFQRLREGSIASPVIGHPMPSPGHGRWVFPIARRLTGPGGEFIGVVGAPGRVDYFQAFYGDAYPAAGTRVALLRDDATLLARHPPAPEALGRQFPILNQLLDAAASGVRVTRNASPLDGVDRFGAVRRVPDYPLAVIVTRDAEMALASWQEQAIGSALRTLALATLAALLLALVLRQLKRLGAAQASLEASQERFELAVLGSDDGLWDWNYATGEAFGSQRARAILGLPPGPELQSLDDWHALMARQLHPDDLPQRNERLAAHLAGETAAYEGEWRVRAPGGDGWRWVRAHGMCVRGPDGRPLRIAGSLSDIDARKRAEEALRLSEERYALAMTGSTGGHWVWEVETDALFVSGTVNQLFGLPADTQARSRSDYFRQVKLHPEDQADIARIEEAALAGRTDRIDFEYRLLIPGQAEPRWILTRAQCFRDAGGRLLRMAGVSVDISERKRTEQALLRSEERYQLAVDGANQGLWDWDLASDMLFLSPRAQQLNFVEPGEPLRPRREWIGLTEYHPDDQPRVRQAIAAHLRGATPEFTVEYRVRHHSGEWHWYRQRGLALRDSQGRPYRMAGSMEDISAPKHAEAERERLEAQLRQAQKLEAIGTLAGGIAHDFNNILSAILGYGEMAQKDAPEGTRQRRHIDAALNAALRAKSLVERILAFSRSGMSERVPVHVHAVVTEALDGVAASLPPGILLERRLDAPEAGVLGDATQIHQVVMNLCANAVQAMRGEGRLTVEVDAVELAAARPVATSVLSPGAYVRLGVRDTGGGIPPEVRERIFDPFFTTKDVGVGTGLGLSLVHGIVTDLGGGIDVDSRPGQGAHFTVYLPRGRYVAAPPAPAEEGVLPGQGETVLLVDDEEALVRLGEELLAELGYEPVGYSSSRQALEAFRAAPDRFQLVLSDEAMPDMTGSELVARIREIRPAVPIVLMSGFVSPALAARAREAGVAEVLAKPLVSRDIARGLASALRNGRP